MKREGRGIWYFRGKRDCDFVCSTGNSRMQAFQVTLQVSSRNVKRETEGLPEAMDRLGLAEGTIITLDQEDRIRKSEKNIHLVPAWKWMD
jgi:predicted AAA+ superfamily ATPase